MSAHRHRFTSGPHILAPLLLLLNMLGSLNVVLVVPTDNHLFCAGVGDCGVTNSLIISLLAWFYGLLFNTRVDMMSVHDQGRSRVGHEIPQGTEAEEMAIAVIILAGGREKTS